MSTKVVPTLGRNISDLFTAAGEEEIQNLIVANSFRNVLIKCRE
jgi:hypothetical protein